MPRASKSAAEVLSQEARAMELLANEIEVPPERLQEYWDVSSELINLVSDIQVFGEMNPDAQPDDIDVKELRRRIRFIAAHLTSLPEDFRGR